ncbi:hypothetical protein AAC03nite_28410 [Alicyclobacillus acidoterrestris]|nr:hypothetical protein AAC03nite_28410 [Alicyclobacillus acidoterrestris]
MAQRRHLLTELRKAKGTLQDVSSELGISKTYLRMIENGTHKPGRDVMIRMSNYFKQPMSALFPDLFSDEPANLLRQK